MSPTRLLAASLFCLAGLILSGCHSYLETGDIDASVAALKLSSLADGRAVVTVRYINDSVAPMSFTKSSHQLYLDGALAATFDNPHPVGLARQTTTTREFSIQLANSAAWQPLLARGPATVHFRLESQFFVQDGDTRNRFKSLSDGTVVVAPPDAP